MIRLARYAGAARKLVGDNSPAILTAVAVVGVVTTAVMVAKAAPQAHLDVQNHLSETTEELTLVDEFKLTYRYYVPAALVGTATIACIIGANTVSTKRTAALASAYGITEMAFRDYKDKVIQHIGETKETKIHDEVMKDFVDRTGPEAQIILSDKGSQLFCDRYSERYFESDMETVKRAMNDTNYQILNDDYASLNDLYRRLEIKPSTIGEEVGWTTDKRLEPRYSAQIITTDDGRTRACITIDYAKAPIRNFDRFG